MNLPSGMKQTLMYLWKVYNKNVLTESYLISTFFLYDGNG